MFDFGFSELLICGVVGLVVLGPERLPTVARTAGQWIGKAQRFVQQMKDDINHEAELAELKKIKEDAQRITDDLNATVQNAAKGIEDDVNAVAGEAQKNLSEAEAAVKTAADEVSQAVGTEERVFDSADFTWDDAPAEDSGPKIFEKRYVSGPSVDELAEEIRKLEARLDMGGRRLTGNNRRYASRARSNRPRIYR